MTSVLKIKNKINTYNKEIQVSGDKSLSIRWVLIASQAAGKSIAHNLLMSEDVLAAIDTIKKLGIKVKICLLYTSPSPRDGLLSRMPSSA